MLVLSRKKDESIMIGHDVEITIVNVRGDKVRLAINAPRSISVHRKEIYEQIQKEKTAKEKAELDQPDICQYCGCTEYDMGKHHFTCDCDRNR